MEKGVISKSASLEDADHFDSEWVPEPYSLDKSLYAAIDEYVPSDSRNNSQRLTTAVGNMILISREESSVYTSGTFALPDLALQRLTKRPLDLCSTLRLSGKSAGIHSDHPREQFSVALTV